MFTDENMMIDGYQFVLFIIISKQHIASNIACKRIGGFLYRFGLWFLTDFGSQCKLLPDIGRYSCRILKYSSLIHDKIIR